MKKTNIKRLLQIFFEGLFIILFLIFLFLASFRVFMSDNRYDEALTSLKTKMITLSEDDYVADQDNFEFNKNCCDIENLSTITCFEKVFLESLQNFMKMEKNCVDHQKSKKNFSCFLSNLEKQFKGYKAGMSEIVDSELIKVSKFLVDKYRDELLKENGFFLKGNYPGGCVIRFETARIFYAFEFPYLKTYRQMRYRIENNSSYSNDDLTNVVLILQNIDGYELVRKFVGQIKSHGWATGEFTIEETDFKKMIQGTLVTDQDLW